MTEERKYSDQQLINSAALVRGAVNLPWLELPEIMVGENEPAVVFLKPLTVHEVFSFNTDRRDALAAAEKAGIEGAAVDDLSAQAPLQRLISQAVVDRNGNKLLKPEDVTQLDLRLYNRIARAVTNMIGGHAPDYEAPVEMVVLPDGDTIIEEARQGNASGEARPTEISSASPTV